MIKSLKERDGDLINNWYIACTSKELSKKPISRVIYDTKIVLFRDSKNISTCLINRCPHRGTPLSKGFCINDTLQCSYHGWQFDKSGIVKNIPSEGKEETKTKRKVQSFPTHEKDGVIWVWFGEEGREDISLIWDFPHRHDKDWHSYYMITDFNNEVTNLVENFVDVPHTVWVHKGWFRNRSFQHIPAVVTTENGVVNVDYDQPNDDIGVFIKPFLNPKNEPMIHTDKFIFPNITRVDYSFGSHFKYVINSQCTPVSTFNSRVYTYIAYKIPLAGGLIKPFLNFYTRKVIEQDVVIMEHQKENLINEEKPRFQSTIADEPHIQIEFLREQGIIGSEKVFEHKKKKEISFYI
jgi:phenylpropionate dioxygenase-like ring-hydroxylating dioxygenase large terminal subunit